MSSSATEFVATGTKPRTKYPGHWWVRIKPYAPNNGAVTQTITIRKLAKSFVEKTGWYSDKYNREQLAVLLRTRTNRSNPNSPAVFDVCTWEEANALDQAAKTRVKTQGHLRRSAEDAVTDAATGSMTVADLPPVHAAPTARAPRERREAKVGPQPPAAAPVMFAPPTRPSRIVNEPPVEVEDDVGGIEDDDVDFDDEFEEPQGD